MKKILCYLSIFFLNFTLGNAKDYLSKDPNYLNRGKLFGKASIANYLKEELDKHNYKVILDPTGTSPFKKIESFSPKKGDCGNNKHWGGKSGGITDCNTNRLRLEVVSNFKISKKLIDKKPKETWLGFFIYIPDDYPNDPYFQPYINQFYGYNKDSRGGYAPQISAHIFKNNLQIFGYKIIDKNDLKGKWHKIEYHIRWSTNDDGFVKVYHNNKLKVNKTGFVTMMYDFVYITYGTYSHKDFGGVLYPENYQFPSHTIYYSGYSVSSKRKSLKINKVK